MGRPQAGKHFAGRVHLDSNLARCNDRQGSDGAEDGAAEERPDQTRVRPKSVPRSSRVRGGDAQPAKKAANPGVGRFHPHT